MTGVQITKPVAGKKPVIDKVAKPVEDAKLPTPATTDTAAVDKVAGPRFLPRPKKAAGVKPPTLFNKMNDKFVKPTRFQKMSRPPGRSNDANDTEATSESSFEADEKPSRRLPTTGPTGTTPLPVKGKNTRPYRQADIVSEISHEALRGVYAVERAALAEFSALSDAERRAYLTANPASALAAKTPHGAPVRTAAYRKTGENLFDKVEDHLAKSDWHERQANQHYARAAKASNSARVETNLNHGAAHDRAKAAHANASDHYQLALDAHDSSHGSAAARLKRAQTHGTLAENATKATKWFTRPAKSKSGSKGVFPKIKPPKMGRPRILGDDMAD